MNRYKWRLLKRKISNAILDALFPLKCARCQGIVKRADAIKAQSTMGVWADVCPPCHRELYPSMYPSHSWSFPPITEEEVNALDKFMREDPE